jgi:endoglycosylceramidase
MIPWLEWAYCGCGDPTTSGAGTVQAIVVDPRKPPVPSNRENTTLHALVEPYPQVIAGTPLSWSYARSTRTFRLRYSTARAGGRSRYHAGSVTEIAAPALVYGTRYSVRVTGGAVASSRGASTLRIVSCRGARNVSVTLAPHGRSRGSCQIGRLRR